MEESGKKLQNVPVFEANSQIIMRDENEAENPANIYGTINNIGVSQLTNEQRNDANFLDLFPCESET